MVSDTSFPIRSAPPAAGGGRASKAVEVQPETQISPQLHQHIKEIYDALLKKKADAAKSSDGPPLTSVADFEAWFASSAASAIAPPPNHDLTYPISNYYISSSHNTYLSGNQFYGASTGDAYENVLRRGCRCLEIDVWDGDDESSSMSSSDLEEDRLARTTSTKAIRGRKRSNSRLSRLRDKVKEKARAYSPGPTPETEKSQTAALQSRNTDDSGMLTAENLGHRGSIGRKYEPRVKHGYTLTKDISFRAVCHAIRNSAFTATDLPVIVSLEVHCTFEQQEIMVDILQTVFSDHLVDISGKLESEVNALPSPEALRNKILIKVKWAPPDANTGESNNPLDHIDSNDNAAVEEPGNNSEKKKKASKILRALSALGVYTRAYTFKQFDQPEAKIPTHVFSLSEAKVEDIHTDPQHGPALFEHNRNFLMRCYPSGMRVDSSNLEPCFLWRQGAQMVALNWQKLDKGMMLNEGMFSGEEGWVLKPEGFRGKCDRHTLDPKATPERRLLDLEIELLAAQNLPMPVDKDPHHGHKLKPYVKLQLHVDTHGPPGRGSSGGSRSDSHAHHASRYPRHHLGGSGEENDKDEEARKLKRRSNTRKTADPDFGNEVMRWTGIHDIVDELSFLRIKINDDRALASDNLVAWSCIKLSRLRNGYRLVHLLDAQGNPSRGVLLVRIQKTLY